MTTNEIVERIEYIILSIGYVDESDVRSDLIHLRNDILDIVVEEEDE